MRVILRDRSYSFVSAALTALLLLNGCGGGGGGGGAPAPAPVTPPPVTPPPANPTATAVFLVGQAGASVPANVVINGTPTATRRANLIAFDPAAPALANQFVLAFAGTYSNEARIESGFYDAASQTLLEPHIRYVVFIQDGLIKKVNLVKGGANPTPTQVSNETGAADLCSFNRKQLVDYTNAENTAIVYGKRGADGACATSDDEWRMVRLSMTAADTPIAARQPVSGLITSAGAALGWLALNGNQLTRYDTNFQNPVVLTTSSGAVEEVTNSVRAFEQAIVRFGNTLYQYDPNDAASPLSPRFSIVFGGGVPGTILTTTRDGQAVFVAVSDASQQTNLYRIPLVGDNNFAQLIEEPAPITVMTTSSARVVYNLNPGVNQQQLKSIPKQGGAATILPILGDLVFTGGSGVTVAVANKVYYNVRETDNSPVAGIVNDDGSVDSPEVPGARWLGLVLEDEFATLSSITTPARILRADGVTSVGPAFNYAGATVRSFDPSTAAQIAVLGQLPPITVNFFTFDRNKDASLGQVLREDVGGGFTADLYTANPNVASSLVRVTFNIN